MAKRVLLVGIDESLAIELQKVRLGNDAEIVDAVSTLRAAVAVIDEREVDVVLISNELSDGIALKLGSQLADRVQAPKVVLIDGVPDQAAEIEALRAGFSAWITEPADPSTIIEAILSNADRRPPPPLG